MRRRLITLLALLASFAMHGQNIGINNDLPDSSAILDIYSSDKGILIPRLTAEKRINIANPAEGLLVYDTDSSGFLFYSGGNWHLLATQAHIDHGWVIEGIDMYSGTPGNIGIGTSAPSSDIHIMDTTGNADIRLSGNSGSYIVGIDEAEGVFNISPDNNSGGFFIDSTSAFGLNGPSGTRFTIGVDEAAGVMSIGADSVGFEDTQILTIGRMGNVGVGTSSPESVLHLADESGPTITFSDSVSERSFGIGFNQSDSSFGIYIDSSASGKAINNVLTIDQAGCVFLGANPDMTAVNITGTLSVEAIQIRGGSASLEDAIVNSDGVTYYQQLKPRVIELYNSGASVLATSLTDVVWGEARVKDTIYSWSPGDDEVGFKRGGRYEIIYTATVNGGDLINTAASQHLISHYDGATYTDIKGSGIYISSEGVPASASRTIILDIAGGDRIKMRSIRNAVSSSAVDGGFGLVIKRLSNAD